MCAELAHVQAPSRLVEKMMPGSLVPSTHLHSGLAQ